MRNIIKSGETDKSSINNFDRDRTASFEDQMLESEIDPAAILANARADAEQKVRQAYEEAVRRGEQAGRDAFDQRVESVCAALDEVADELRQARTAFLESTEKPLVELARILAETIVGRELETDPTVIQRTANTVLKQALGTEHIVLHINPDDFTALADHRDTLDARFENIGEIELREDPDIAPGGCVATTNQMTIDAQIEARLRAMVRQLLGETEAPDGGKP